MSFFYVDVMHICLHLDEVIIPWEPTERADFLALNFIGF